MLRKLLAAACFALLWLTPQLAQAASCYIREYQVIAQIATQPAQIAPDAGTSIDQTPVAIGAAASSAPFNTNTNYVRLICGASVSFKFGPSPQTATTSNSVLPALLPEYFAVAPGQVVSFISNASP